MDITMTKMGQIDTLASDIIAMVYNRAWEDIKPPIDLALVLKKAGLTLKFGKFKNEYISGYYDKKNHTIYISEDENFSRQVFTIAHELGHFFLHEEKIHDVFYRIDSLKLQFENSEEEKEANFFAASLLMPKVIIKKYWQVSRNTKEMSILFHVSESAMIWRLTDLNLL